MGDHGQTLSGDHGGGSVEEVETALFAVNLGAASLELGSRSLLKLALEEEVNADETLSDDFLKTHITEMTTERFEQLEVFEQIDFAASLAAMLGLSIPFENVGAQFIS
jgi:phosphatidylinositol glycan class O